MPPCLKSLSGNLFKQNCLHIAVLVRASDGTCACQHTCKLYCTSEILHVQMILNHTQSHVQSTLLATINFKFEYSLLSYCSVFKLVAFKKNSRWEPVYPSTFDVSLLNGKKLVWIQTRKTLDITLSYFKVISFKNDLTETNERSNDRFTNDLRSLPTGF